jgi:hypothetical protein
LLNLEFLRLKISISAKEAAAANKNLAFKRRKLKGEVTIYSIKMHELQRQNTAISNLTRVRCEISHTE